MRPNKNVLQVCFYIDFFSDYYIRGNAGFRRMEREDGGSNLGPVKSDMVLPTAHHRYSIYLEEAMLPWRNDA